MHRGADEHGAKKAVICFCSCLYQVLSHILDVSLPPSACLNPLCRHPPLPPRRSPLVLRLFALALADGSGLPFSLHPPPAALESQTPQREARALPRRAPKLATSERKIVTKETHQGCLSFLFKSPLPCKGEARALPRRALMLPKCEAQKLSPPTAGCPHPARCGAAPRRATFPKGKAKRSRRRAQN